MNLIGVYPIKEGVLVKKTYSHSATGSLTTTTQITVPTGRGPVTALSVFFESATLADLDGVRYTIGGNGKTIIEDGDALSQSALFTGEKADIVPILVNEGGTIDFSVNNDQANAIPTRVTLYFGR